ncbi:MAG: hypothetical protein Q9222_004130 [Ikaeria aurantiellina]
MEARAKLRYRALPLLANPLKQEPFGPDSYVEKDEAMTTSDNRYNGTPAFREKEEASSIELFYDLFFVANLTSFTSIHAIDDRETILSYIGFFALLWFTWLQVVLYDVRFGVDSLFERLAKLVHIGVMITFAIVGTRFDSSHPRSTYDTMRQISIVLMISRVVLICQYGFVMLWVKGHKKIVTPLSIHVAAFTTGAVFCLSFFFTFTSRSSGQAYIAWYVIIAAEALAVFFSASQWTSVGFQRTNLSERCGLLTLIILGEGIIVLAKSMNYVVQGENFSPAIVAQIISAIFIIYSVYMLYFDTFTPHNPSSSPICHHFWALAHFPFHTALVLLLEGTSRLITWRNAIEIINHVYEMYSTIWDSSTSTVDLADQYANSSYWLLQAVQADQVKYNVTGYVNDLRMAGDKSSDVASNAAFEIMITIVNATLKFFHIQPAHRQEDALGDPSPESNTDPYVDLEHALVVYDLVFLYFFLAAGLTLVLMALLIALNRQGRGFHKGDWMSIGLRLVAGTGLALVAAVKTSQMQEERFLYSPWMVPTVMLGLLGTVVGDGIIGWALPARENKKHGHDRGERGGEA